MFNTHSKFWIGGSNEADVLTGKVDTGKDHMKLAATLRAVSNFVNIVTGESIPVEYKGKDSYTDGKSITISANIKDKNFDPTVGLALHEGSHCKLTDFTLLGKLDQYMIVNSIEPTYENRNLVRSLLNYVEDRRIDCFVYTNAPGYKPYYKAMYDTYFHSKAIDKGLKSTEYRTETWESYMFRLINITNFNRDLDALKGLKDVWSTLDLGNVTRLESTEDALNVAIELFKIIDANIEPPVSEETEQPNPTSGENGTNEEDEEETTGGGGGNESPETPEGKSEDDGSTTEGDDVKSDTTPGDYDLNDKEKKSLESAIEKQKSFNEGKVNKTQMSKSDKKKVEAIKDSGASSKTVGDGSNNAYNSWKKPTVDCIVVKDMTRKVVDSAVYDCVLLDPKMSYQMSKVEKNQEAVNKGIRLGTMLGRKLEIRNQDNTLKYNRLRSGKIDRRAIASLGFGAEAVFEKIVTTSHNAACLHISIDASGSMNGSRWTNSQIAAIAIAKAASMTNNMDVVISYRSIYGYHQGDTKPLVMLAYDSRKDSINKITNLFRYLTPGGSTPAGLCFEAILDEINGMGGADTDKYFINFSDGNPYFQSTNFDYSGERADKHIRKQVNNMRAAGVKILSYFIDGSSDNSRQRSSFDYKYGKQSTAYVPVADIIPLAKSLNKTFIER